MFIQKRLCSCAQWSSPLDSSGNSSFSAPTTQTALLEALTHFLHLLVRGQFPTSFSPFLGGALNSSSQNINRGPAHCHWLHHQSFSFQAMSPSPQRPHMHLPIAIKVRRQSACRPRSSRTRVQESYTQLFRRYQQFSPSHGSFGGLHQRL